MLVGHFGIAELGKGARRDLSFLWLVVAAYLPDLTRAALAPFTTHFDMLSHSLPAVAISAIAIAGLWVLRGGKPMAAAVLALACLLHWPADVFTGCKPTVANGPWIGLMSYRRPVSDLLLEGGLLVLGWWLARRSGFGLAKRWLVVAFAVQLAFLASMYYGSEILVGHREWIWRPRESLVPQPHVLETLNCRPPEESWRD
jgi:hypothetical protein